MSEMNGVNPPPREDSPRPDTSRFTFTADPKERLQKLLDTVNSGSAKTIRDLACEFRMSASHIQHLFKAETGSCLGRTLTEERLRKAAALLMEGKLSVKEIAYIVGYKHPSSFIRAFDRLFGQAPSRYRQAMNEIAQHEM
jgi:AraC-like DNA-binding protein